MRQLKITKQVTNRETPSLDKYLHEIGKESLLTPEEEVELACLIKKGDKVALDRLVKANLRFVVSVSKQYQNQGLSLGDLIDEGNLGLIKAANRFDPTKGFKFISYAVWWCRQSIMQAIAECSRMVRLPMNKCALMSKVNKTSAQLEQKYERAPSAQEIAEVLDMNEDDVKESIKNAGRYISMDAPLVEGEDSNLYDVIRSDESPRPDEGLIKESLRIDILRAMSNLSPRERDIIEKFYGLDRKPGRTLEEIGQEHDLTRERVRQIKDKACKKLRHSSRSRILRDYLDMYDQ
ncbi:sigma-70 family RNA polymerase sigma factor [Bacteroidetes bacterium endosymbiont of Geopemphigus sp.]|uniref:sigma-70 family RNA polymerase sigma factor n=1 Tax=Bacteroidetes bacterium endosymbiont of Geopemphigus sp. TaxID=2047937 RepID=UPI000CD24473|nr:RNA polymerase sigma factor RpoD/SigA [Bacteroidetes bacterium endosymbiont of Geopemphigus sp.]